MATLVKRVSNSHLIEFDQGAFDGWCVYLTRAGQMRYAPKDAEYFSALCRLAEQHGAAQVYGDFVAVYTRTGPQVDPGVLELISRLAGRYQADAREMDIWLTVIYAGMVAEENKAHGILKKRIKRLGIHQVLREGMFPEEAATFSRGKNWRELDALMKQKGF